MNEFTLMLLNQGWQVNDACNYWGINQTTWYNMRKRESDRNKLECMIRGLPERDINNLAKGND